VLSTFISEVLTEANDRFGRDPETTRSFEDRVVDLARIRVLAWRARLAELVSWGFRFAVGAALLTFDKVGAVVLGAAVLAALSLMWRLRYELLRRGRRAAGIVLALTAIAATGGVLVAAILLERPGAGGFFVAGEVFAALSRRDRAETRRLAGSDVVVA
jgi:hypothetical protein